MRAGAAGEDVSGPGDLLDTAQRLGVVRYQAEDLVQQGFKLDNTAFAEVDESFNIDVSDIESKITPRTKGIIICNPNNPTGRILSAGTATGARIGASNRSISS